MEADYNPVGSYIKTFELDEGPKGKKYQSDSMAQSRRCMYGSMDIL